MTFLNHPDHLILPISGSDIFFQLVNYNHPQTSLFITTCKLQPVANKPVDHKLQITTTCKQSCLSLLVNYNQWQTSLGIIACSLQLLIRKPVYRYL
jgi:hypothetical protein